MVAIPYRSVEVQPRKDEHTLRTEDIVAKINELGDRLALVCFGGVNFYTDKRST